MCFKILGRGCSLETSMELQKSRQHDDVKIRTKLLLWPLGTHGQFPVRCAQRRATDLEMGPFFQADSQRLIYLANGRPPSAPRSEESGE